MPSKNILIVGAVVVAVIIGAIVYLGVGKGGLYPSISTQKANQPTVEGTAIELKNFKFSPETLEVKPGEKFTFTNKDITGHTLTSDDGKSFDSGLLGKDESKVMTAPTKPGSYPFHCTSHPSITGALIVK